MNQYREWDGRCQWCFELSDSYTMSIVDVRLICLKCSELEKKESSYEKKERTDAVGS